MRRVWGIFKCASIALSAVLALSVLVLWTRSYSGSDHLTWTRAWREGEGARQKWVQLVSKRGRIYLDVGRMETSGEASGPTALMTHDLISTAQRLAGRAEFQLMRDERKYPDPPPQKGAWRPIRWAEWGYSQPGLGVSTGGSSVIVYDWLAAMVFLIGPVWWSRKRVRLWRRMRKGLCLGCGYDLRESPERCPECGAENSAPETLKSVGASKLVL